ncbi:MAG: N-acetylmuramoyl-L-alanine amidase [Butyricicoccus pullicaecorum]|nr:N-acetylmuramoyl-L-alanine amidase [Butyricicoccus pullicaecorum]
MKIIAYPASHAAPKTRRRRRRNFRPLIVLLLILFIFVGIGVGIGRVLHRAGDKEPGYEMTEIRGLPIYRHFLEKEAVGRIGGTREVQYIVIHETDNFAAGANAARHDAFIHQNAMQEKLSWHYTIDDHEGYQHIPDTEPAYHAGDGMQPNGGNTNGIGIELCVAEDNDYEQTLKNGAILAGYLLYQYDLGMDALKKHQDFSGKICPARLIEENRWEEFCNMVQDNYTYFKENGTN